MKLQAGRPRMKDSRIMDANILDLLTERLTMDVASLNEAGPLERRSLTQPTEGTVSRLLKL